MQTPTKKFKAPRKRVNRIVLILSKIYELPYSFVNYIYNKYEECIDMTKRFLSHYNKVSHYLEVEEPITPIFKIQCEKVEVELIYS